jgi:periplasmic protein CpxP/Spy
MTDPIFRTGRAAALLLGALLALPVVLSPAAAQTPPPPQAGQPPGSAMEPRIQQLRQMLHITAAQEADFDAFANVMRSNEVTMRSLVQQRPPGVNTSAVESLRFEQRFAAAQAEGLRRLIGPFVRLYASLSPAQKQLANQIFVLRPAPPGRG